MAPKNPTILSCMFRGIAHSTNNCNEIFFIREKSFLIGFSETSIIKKIDILVLNDNWTSAVTAKSTYCLKKSWTEKNLLYLKNKRSTESIPNFLELIIDIIFF